MITWLCRRDSRINHIFIHKLDMKKHDDIHEYLLHIKRTFSHKLFSCVSSLHQRIMIGELCWESDVLSSPVTQLIFVRLGEDGQMRYWVITLLLWLSLQLISEQVAFIRSSNQQYNTKPTKIYFNRLRQHASKDYNFYICTIMCTCLQTKPSNVNYNFIISGSP